MRRRRRRSYRMIRKVSIYRFTLLGTNQQVLSKQAVPNQVVNTPSSWRFLPLSLSTSSIMAHPYQWKLPDFPSAVSIYVSSPHVNTRRLRIRRTTHINTLTISSPISMLCLSLPLPSPHLISSLIPIRRSSPTSLLYSRWMISKRMQKMSPTFSYQESQLRQRPRLSNRKCR